MPTTQSLTAFHREVVSVVKLLQYDGVTSCGTIFGVQIPRPIYFPTGVPDVFLKACLIDIEISAGCFFDEHLQAALRYLVGRELLRRTKRVPNLQTCRFRRPKDDAIVVSGVKMSQPEDENEKPEPVEYGLYVGFDDTRSRCVAATKLHPDEQTGRVFADSVRIYLGAFQAIPCSGAYTVTDRGLEICYPLKPVEIEEVTPHNDDARMSPTQIAEQYNIPERRRDAFRKKLERWRKENAMGKDWFEDADAASRDARFYYRVGAVRDIIDEYGAA